MHYQRNRRMQGSRKEKRLTDVSTLMKKWKEIRRKDRDTEEDKEERNLWVEKRENKNKR